MFSTPTAHTGSNIDRTWAVTRSTAQPPKPKTRSSLPSAGAKIASAHTSARRPWSVPPSHLSYHRIALRRPIIVCATTATSSNGNTHHENATSTTLRLTRLTPWASNLSWVNAPSAGVFSVQLPGSALAFHTRFRTSSRSSVANAGLVTASRATSARCAPSIRAVARKNNGSCTTSNACPSSSAAPNTTSGTAALARKSALGPSATRPTNIAIATAETAGIRLAATVTTTITRSRPGPAPAMTRSNRARSRSALYISTLTC